MRSNACLNVPRACRCASKLSMARGCQRRQHGMQANGMQSMRVVAHVFFVIVFFRHVCLAGESERKVNAPRVVALLEQAGAAAVTVHGRTMEQR